MGVCALGLASFSLVLSIVPGLSLMAGAYQKDFATVTLTSSAWSFPFLRGRCGDLWLFLALFFINFFWGVKIGFLIFGKYFFK